MENSKILDILFDPRLQSQDSQYVLEALKNLQLYTGKTIAHISINNKHSATIYYKNSDILWETYVRE